MEHYSKNIHCRISRKQMEKVNEVCEHYQTSISNLIRYWIHQGLLVEHKVGSTQYINTMNQQQRGF